MKFLPPQNKNIYAADNKNGNIMNYINDVDRGKYIEG